MAWVNLTPFGKAVDDVLRHYDLAHEGIKVCKRKVLDDHIHVVLWVQKQQYSTVQHKPQSILQIAYGMRVQFTHIAQELGVWPKGVRVEGALHAEKGAGHVFEKQFVRTLSRSGQLRKMIDYVELNVYRKYMRYQNPDLFTMHKDTVVEGLRFRSMGNHWLLDWPERQMVECSLVCVRCNLVGVRSLVDCRVMGVHVQRPFHGRVMGGRSLHGLHPLNLPQQFPSSCHHECQVINTNPFEYLAVRFPDEGLFIHTD